MSSFGGPNARAGIENVSHRYSIVVNRTRLQHGPASVNYYSRTNDPLSLRGKLLIGLCKINRLQQQNMGYI